MNDPTAIHDTIIVGGGPAGLSGALLLGRCRRKVLLFDEGRPRNEASPAVHAFLGHEGIAPLDLLERGRDELARYPNVASYKRRVENIEKEPGFYKVIADDNSEFRSRALLIATGLIDHLPRVDGIEDFYGHSVHQCPYCDGWENAGMTLGAMGAGNQAAELALELLLWSDDVSLFVNGDAPAPELVGKLERRGVKVFADPPVRLAGEAKRLSAVELADGTRVACDALFLLSKQTQHDDFAERLGCELVDGSQVHCDGDGRTSMPGLFVAGNATEGLQLARVAAAEVLKAAAAIYLWLLDSDDLDFNR